ncbi:MAG: HlyD family efflux transporter periplasmic adaptor subunit [Treponema sp.]|jgi:HlyD family secretion protein|nr:HlyD family efflux transporter periplasmic adaptor subunit [Treponema sp.]
MKHLSTYTAVLSVMTVSMTILITSCRAGEDNFDASGSFGATEVIVSAEVSGKILSLAADEGAVLSAGTAVGRIDTVQLELRRSQLLANRKGVEARRPNVSVQIAATVQQIATAKKEKARIENLLKSDAANTKQLDDIDSTIAILEKQLAAQRLTLETNSLGIDEDSSALAIQVAQLDDQIARATVSSPIDGTVLAKYAEAGELASPGKALFKVADVSQLYLRAYITADQLSRIKIGQRVKVMSEYGDKAYREYDGTVSWISDKSEFTPKTVQTRNERTNLVYAVKVSVRNDGYLKIGMYGGMKITK